MERKPYLTDGIIGNSKLLATMNIDGNLVRLWWPQITYPQHMDKSFGGVYVKGETENTLWMNDPEFNREQAYMEDTNILLTKALSKSFGLEIELTDFAAAGRDTLVRNYKIFNNGSIEKEITFLYYTAFQTHDSKLYCSAYFDYENDALVHYKHKYAFAIGSTEEIYQFTAKDALEDAEDGKLDGWDTFLTASRCLSFNLGVINPGEYREVTIFIACGEGHKAALDELSAVKDVGYGKLLNETQNYWEDYLSRGKQINISNKRIENIYKRSLLIFKMLSDEKHGAIAAAPEVDEAFERCGGYGYCWGRDAAYIVSAIDKAGYTELSTRFFHWARRVQERNGGWEQRYHMDGYLAPCWGSQIDETGAILWGIYHHFECTKDMDFLKELWESIKNGAEYLIKSLDRETGLPKPSMDLWEERKGEHLYSASSVYGGFISASKAAELLGFNDLEEKYLAEAESIKKAIIRLGWREDNKTFLRSIKREIDSATAEKFALEGKKIVIEQAKKGYVKYYLYEDEIIDISLLGISEPFGILGADDERMKLTAELIEKKLWVPEVGGIKRYEDDKYIGGNPWILTTLWLALFRIRDGQNQRALELLEWAASHSTSLNLLSEQIDKNTGEPAWVLPLAWSHAMFVLTVLELIDKLEL